MNFHGYKARCGNDRPRSEAFGSYNPGAHLLQAEAGQGEYEERDTHIEAIL